jgi:hypothetical protein
MRVGFGKRGEVGVLPGDVSTVPEVGDRARQAVLDKFMRGDGLQQVCVWIAERLPPGKGPAKRRRGRKPRRKKQVIAIPTAVWRWLPATQVVPAQGATGELGTVDSHALLVEPGCEKQLLALSAPRMDRRLQRRKREREQRIYGLIKPGALLKHISS